MTPGKDEIVLSRVFDKSTGGESLLLIHPNDLTESEALTRVSDGLDLTKYERQDSKTRSHWLDKLGGNPGHNYVVFRKIP